MQAALALFDDDDDEHIVTTKRDIAPIAITAAPQLKSLLQRVTVPLQDAEQCCNSSARQTQHFSAGTHEACVAVLRKHGVLVLRNVFDPHYILEWRDRFMRDLVSDCHNQACLLFS